METTLTLAQGLGMPPLDLLAHDDTDDIILLINHFIEKGNNAPEKPETKQPQKDNFWDF